MWGREIWGGRCEGGEMWGRGGVGEGRCGGGEVWGRGGVGEGRCGGGEGQRTSFIGLAISPDVTNNPSPTHMAPQ